MSHAKRPRKIQVNEIDYVWNVRTTETDYPGYAVLTIWLADTRYKSSSLQVRFRYDNPWLNFGTQQGNVTEQKSNSLVSRPLTPGLVHRIIELGRTNGWQPEENRTALKFEWTQDDKFVVPEDKIQVSNS